MVLRRLRRLVVTAGAAAACMAMSAGIAQAACYGQQQQLPQQTIDQFLASPAQFLSQYPDGGAQMISLVRDLAASNPAALPAIIALLATANANQATAIGTGLGQAAQVCVRTDQPYAVQVQQALTATNNQDAILAMAAVIGDRPIGGLGGGGGGGSAGAGGPTNPSPTVGFGSSSTSFFRTNSTLTTSQNYFNSGVSTTPGSASTTKTVTTPSSSVSPSR
jgi:hypothetical protein